MTFFESKDERVLRCVRCDTVVVRCFPYGRDDAVCEGCARADFVWEERPRHLDSPFAIGAAARLRADADDVAEVVRDARRGRVGASRHWPVMEPDGKWKG